MTLTEPCPPPPHPATGHPTRRAEAISPDDARLVLQYFGHAPLGAPATADSFHRRLVALIAEADVHHRRALARAYPALVAAVQLARTSPTGITTLHAIAHTR